MFRKGTEEFSAGKVYWPGLCRSRIGISAAFVSWGRGGIFPLNSRSKYSSKFKSKAGFLGLHRLISSRRVMIQRTVVQNSIWTWAVRKQLEALHRSTCIASIAGALDLQIILEYLADYLGVSCLEMVMDHNSSGIFTIQLSFFYECFSQFNLFFIYFKFKCLN